MHFFKQKNQQLKLKHNCITLSVIFKENNDKNTSHPLLLKYCKNNLVCVYNNDKNQENIKYITYLQKNSIYKRKQVSKATIIEEFYCTFTHNILNLHIVKFMYIIYMT